MERWIWTKKLTVEDVARRSGHEVGYVRELFKQAEPNPSLRLYLDLLEAAGARMDTANGNTVEHVVSRLSDLRKRAGLTVSELARRSGVGRSHLSGIVNGSKSNMQLSIFDVLISALGAEEEMRLVERYYTSQLVQLALAAGGENVTASDSPTRPHLHAVPDVGSTGPQYTPGPSRATVSTPRAAPGEADRRDASEKARADAAAAHAARESARADQANARAQQERARADQEAARADKEKARAAQETARAEQAAANARQAAARAEFAERLLVGAGIGLVIVGGVCVYKGLAPHAA